MTEQTALVARMEAAGRNPGRSTAVAFFKARPGFSPKGTSFGAHPGYHSTGYNGPRSPDEGRRPQSGEKHRVNFSPPPRIPAYGLHPGYKIETNQPSIVDS
jgi:hypothetical protein